jgi:hypothetical protein
MRSQILLSYDPNILRAYVRQLDASRPEIGFNSFDGCLSGKDGDYE